MQTLIPLTGLFIVSSENMEISLAVGSFQCGVWNLCDFVIEGLDAIRELA